MSGWAKARDTVDGDTPASAATVRIVVIGLLARPGRILAGVPPPTASGVVLVRAGRRGAGRAIARPTPRPGQRVGTASSRPRSRIGTRKPSRIVVTATADTVAAMAVKIATGTQPLMPSRAIAALMVGAKPPSAKPIWVPMAMPDSRTWVGNCSPYRAGHTPLAAL